MSSNLKHTLSKKEESRKIVKTIIEYGIDENQKIDIMYFIALSIEDNDILNKISIFLKKFKTSINNEQEEPKIKIKSNKILT
jgi:regulator of RNase E activity RraB